GPPTNTAHQAMNAFDAGWGGVVWKTIGEPIVNTSSRYGAIDIANVKMMGFNNIELISDRPIDVNFREITEVKKKYSKQLVIASLMVESKRESWHEMVLRAHDAGADALELNFGCPHGMSERGMGSSVGQVPEYTEMITSWVKESAKIPVIVKLTPNVTDITRIAEAAQRGGADAVSLINTINSLIGVDLETFTPRPDVGGKSSHGGYCGPAIKPIALHLVASVAKAVKLPISGIGGIGLWNDAAEHIAVGASTVQVCTAAMHYGFRIVEDMIDGLSQYMDAHGFRTVADFCGRAVPNVKDWGDLDLNYKIIADINRDLCIGCQLCYIACEDGAHQAIAPCSNSSNAASNGPSNLKMNPQGMGVHVPRIIEEECVGCNLCALVCPVENCITMKRVDNGKPPMSWKQRTKSDPTCAPPLPSGDD
ncbi:MAG TPA: NAD-dependent dihydropyrimidine dehydrogenase subunit PreA, partial [Candidatus Acidoferrales bacterium]|nr:NAD-dependent dihydropyrimidine dehydrogenase subunit PreA [Candidatus Acidoferrales bacterium]